MEVMIQPGREPSPAGTGGSSPTTRTDSAQARRLAGEAIVIVPLPWRLLAGFLISIVLVAVVVACSAEYARKETVPGWVVPSSGLIRVQARQGGLLTELRVKEGDLVPAGAVLASLRLSPDLGDGADVGSSLDRELQAEASAIAEQAQAETSGVEATRGRLQAQRVSATAEVAELERGMAALQRQHELARKSLERTETVASRGFVSERMLDDRRHALLSIEREIATTGAAIIGRRARMVDLDGQLDALAGDRSRVAARAAQARAAVAQRRVTSLAQSAYAVVAPVAGQIAVLPLAAGQEAATGSTLVVLVPAGSRLEAELYVPSRAVGFIRSGQEVRLMYQAFPYQKFGTARGRISSVSRTVLAPEEIQAPGVRPQEASFRARVELDRPYVEAYGEQVRVIPGMLLSADIVVERRTLFEWLFDPLLAAGRR